MGAFEQPAADLRSVTFDTDYTTVKGFMLSRDATLAMTMASGVYRIYPRGTFEAKRVYRVEVQRVRASGSAPVLAGKVYFLMDKSV